MRVCVRICGRGCGHGRWCISARVWAWARVCGREVLSFFVFLIFLFVSSEQKKLKTKNSARLHCVLLYPLLRPDASEAVKPATRRALRQTTVLRVPAGEGRVRLENSRTKEKATLGQTPC